MGEVRIATYNIRHAQGIEGLISHKRVARTLALTRCDAAVLTEVWRVGTRLDQPALLSELTGMEPLFSAVHRSLGRDTGNLLLVRGRIIDSAVIDLGGRQERRACLVAEVEVAGERFRLAGTHLTLDRRTRALQFRQLVDELPDDLPLVLAGDFNAAPAELGVLRERFIFAEKPPSTFPSVLPFRALDHIGVSGPATLLGVETYPSLASDHLPLVGRIQIEADDSVNSD